MRVIVFRNMYCFSYQSGKLDHLMKVCQMKVLMFQHKFVNHLHF